VQARWDVGHRTMLRDTTLALGDGLLLGNSYPLQELGYAVNGILQEGCSWNDNGGFNATIGTLRKMARDAAATPRFGSGFAGPLVFECHTRCCTSLCSLPNNQTIGCEDTAAAFLIGAGSDHYFGTGEWADGARLTSDYILGLMDVPLGDPDGEAVYDPAGTLWTRTFAGGVAAGGTTVTVNVSVHNQSGSIWRAHGQPAELCASMLSGMCGAARVVNASSCEHCIETNASPLHKAGCTHLDRSMTKAWCSKTTVTDDNAQLTPHDRDTAAGAPGHALEVRVEAGERAEVVVFNPLGWQRVSVVEVVLPPALRVAHGRPAPEVIPHHETFSTTIQPPYSSAKGWII
jgi:hypothetical protein